jgi:3-methyladenine DNA glycosylase AlkD
MTVEQVMSHLKKTGTAQNVKVYRNHGAKGELYGVSFAELGKLKKQIKVDHALALSLWETGNVDARTMATMIADPSKVTAAVLDRWVNAVDYYGLAGMVSSMAACTPLARSRATKWMKSKKEYVRQCGYSTLASALKEGVEIDDSECAAILATIEKEIHGSPNRARYAMNNALIAIGVYRPSLREAAISTAHRIGKVEVDHGKASCETPDAVGYIRKVMAHKK